ncbi:hypothetical protein JI58_08470 [Marinosulfonomonas sp. PRT-SC04]|nr:hypothetical protein JI58_08470 [Marinosulfonomonas sp. PRT-SC04]
MTFFEWFKVLWPFAAMLGAFALRLEVGQVLNKQRMKSMEKDINNAKTATDKDIEGVHSRLSRHENDTHKFLSEIRTDIKTLLSRHP